MAQGPSTSIDAEHPSGAATTGCVRLSVERGKLDCLPAGTGHRAASAAVCQDPDRSGQEIEDQTVRPGRVLQVQEMPDTVEDLGTRPRSG